MAQEHSVLVLTAEQEEELVERIAKKVVAHMYEEVGRSVLAKLIWATGVVAISAIVFLAGKDAIIK